MGTPDFAVPSLQALIDNGYNVIGVVTQPDRPKGRKQLLTPPPVKIIADKHNIPVYQPEKVSSEEQINKFKQLEIDLIITAAFGQLLSNELLAIPKLGCINVHASLLPKYRGGAPIHWAVINGEPETGVTIMYMEEKLDAGAIIAQQSVPIAITDTTGKVYEKVMNIGAKLLIEIIPNIIKGDIQAIPQDHTKATFAYNIRRSDELINWDRSSIEIYNQIRGLAPWPGAYTTHNGQILKIWDSEISTDEFKETSNFQNGTVYKLTKQGPIVITGDGCIVLKEVQPAGKKAISGFDYVNSGKITEGMIFGS